MNFTAVFPNNQDVMDPNIQIFQLRSKKVDIQNYICEQINFFTALYDDDNDLITSKNGGCLLSEATLLTKRENGKIDSGISSC